jgi:hypothetical protein
MSYRLSTAYMLLEYIGPNTGQMLFITWEKHRNDPLRRQKLFQGMARLILSFGAWLKGIRRDNKGTSRVLACYWRSVSRRQILFSYWKGRLSELSYSIFAVVHLKVSKWPRLCCRKIVVCNYGYVKIEISLTTGKGFEMGRVWERN